MREELKSKEVLAMYDIRGIQSYIFKSNLAKEIIGASVLVKDIIKDGLEAYVGEENEEYILDWQKDNATEFLNNESVQMQVMFIGGGNAYVLFRTGDVCEKVNRFLARYILENTYSLNLAVAVVEKTNSYKDDYTKINNEMRRIKAHMPLSQPMGALPFMKADSITGYPLTAKEMYPDKTEFICTEAKLKREKFPKNESEKVFDNMVTEKGDNSTLAVCHIDGNSMGQFIKDIMSVKPHYKEAILAMREISSKISDTFKNTFKGMEAYMETLSGQIKPGKLHRKIVVAGDDITFVCNAKLAIPAVKYFLSHIGEQEIVVSGEKEYFSACAGIAYFNSHFPFSDAYQVAEACCSSAKNRAKAKENRGKNEKVGNFFDFQICTNVRAADLSAYRDKHYKTNEGLFIARPYYVSTMKDEYKINTKNEKYSVKKLDAWLERVNLMPRSKAKQLRDIIPMGENEREKKVSFLTSRGYKDFEKSEKEYPVWYDALEIMDFSLEEGGTDENKN